jgi:hypothetical protein
MAEAQDTQSSRGSTAPAVEAAGKDESITADAQSTQSSGDSTAPAEALVAAAQQKAAELVATAQ